MWFWVGCCVVGVAGCGSDPIARIDWTDERSVDRSWRVFGPRSIEVHPLTRLGREEAGEEVLVLHFELRDAFGQRVKAPGRLRVELSRPYQEGSVSGGAGPSVWNVGLVDPRENSLAFDDFLTRTYVVYLGRVPAWLTQWYKGRGGVGGRPEVVVAFTTEDENGEELVLQHTYRLRR